MILARSLVNLTINMGYVGRAQDPDEPARDFIAAGRIAHRDFIKQFPQLPAEWGTNVDWPAHEKRAKRWEKVSIWKRARRAGMETMYREHYCFGSSYEHSDAWSLASFWGPSDETNQQISNHRSDNLVEIALAITFMAMAVLVEMVAAAFQLPEAQTIATLRATFGQLGTGKSTSGG
jgi:hypothetical protein